MANSDGYDRVVSNKSGVIDIYPLNRGIRIVIEDNNDICSIGLSNSEIKELVSYLLIILVKNEV